MAKKPLGYLVVNKTLNGYDDVECPVHVYPDKARAYRHAHLLNLINDLGRKLTTDDDYVPDPTKATTVPVLFN